VAVRAKVQANQRRARECQAALAGPAPEKASDPSDPFSGALWTEVRRVLDEELGRLPEKYRAPLILCYLEGKTNDEAADQLGWTRGTIAGRLSRARELLRGRLTRRGLSTAVGTVASVFPAEAAPAPVPALLARTTLEAAVTYSATPAGGEGGVRGVTASTLSPAVALAEGVLTTMPVAKVRLTVAVVMLLGILGTGAGFALSHALDQVGSRPRPDVSVPAPARFMRADSPVIVVTTFYPRAGQVIAAHVAEDIEKQCKGIEGLVRIESMAQSHQYTARLYFRPGTDPASAMKLVQSRVALAEPVLPPDMVQKNKVAVKVGKAEYGPSEVAIIIMDRGDKFFWGDSEELQKAASAVVKRLEAEGVLTKPQVFPRFERLGFEIHPQPAKCAALGVTVTEVNQAVQKLSPSTVAATCPGCGRTIQLQPHELSMLIECAKCGTRFVPSAVDGKTITPEEVKKVVVRDKVTVGDVATFKDNHGQTADYRVDGYPATRKVFPRVEGSGFEIRVESAKCAALGVTLTEVKQVVEKRLGSADGKTIAPEEVKNVVVLGRVTVGDVADFKDNYGQTADYRVDGIPAIRITGVPPEGKSVAEAAANCVELTGAELKRLGSRGFAVQDLFAK
jgi:hypothetical protein